MRFPQFFVLNCMRMYGVTSFTVVFSLLVFSSVARSDDGVRCISRMDASNRRIEFSGDLQYHVRVDRPLLKAALLAIVRIHLPCNWSQDFQEMRLCDDANCDGNNGSVQVTMVASRNRMFYLLGPLLYDIMTLGAMDVAERTNITDVLLPLAPCAGREDEVYRETVRLLLLSSDIDTDKWNIVPISNSVSMDTAQVTLFMSTALFSVFQTFITFPFLVTVAGATCCHNVQRDTIQVLLRSSFIDTSLISVTLMMYWTGISAYYYTCDEAAKILFQSAFFSPFTMCLMFYLLACITSFTGGTLFSKCRAKMQYNRLEQIGYGFLSAFLTAAVYHSFFLLLALIEDFLTVFSYLIVFTTLVLMLFLGTTAIVIQYRKTLFRGYFLLVVMMQLIGFVLYLIFVKAFEQLTIDPDVYVATKAYFSVVSMVSPLGIGFSVSILVMVASQGGQTQTKTQKKPSDPENANTYCNTTPGSEQKDLQLVGQTNHHNMADLAAVAREMGFIVLIPTVVQAWENRKEKERV